MLEIADRLAAGLAGRDDKQAISAGPSAGVATDAEIPTPKLRRFAPKSAAEAALSRGRMWIT